MATEVAIQGTGFLINGRPAYEGREYNARSVQGLLLNSRMVQAVFDDECPATRPLWRYPDTGVWDPERNTDEFCAALPAYRSHGLLAVTVGLQGGGSVYHPEVYDNYINSAYEPDGEFKPAYFDRLARVLDAADRAGMVVIVNYFYWKQANRLESARVIESVTERVTAWLLATGRRNILIDVMNEAHEQWGPEALKPRALPRIIDIVKRTTLDGRRIPAGVSTCGGMDLPTPAWLDAEDFTMPHGNGVEPGQLSAKLRALKAMDGYRRRPRPVVVNEDSVFVENLEAALAEGCSWGFYHQGFGCGYKDRMDWTAHPRETRYEDLSGFQTVPVNWSINDDIKRRFFERVKAVTQGR